MEGKESQSTRNMKHAWNGNTTQSGMQKEYQHNTHTPPGRGPDKTIKFYLRSQSVFTRISQKGHMPPELGLLLPAAPLPALREQKGDPGRLVYLTNMVSFGENCEANIRSLGVSTALSLYSMYDFWQIPSSVQDSVTPSIERDLGCIWATFSLFFQTSLSVVSKSSVYFSGLLPPRTPLYLLYHWQINCFLLDGVLPLQNGEPV